MIVTVLALALAAAPAETEHKATPCGLEEVGDPALKVCPPHVTYDEEGEEVEGQAAESEDQSASASKAD